ncbi:MAG: hypothetical protein AB7T27_02980 [Kiritimatiellia bacterium]
MKRKEKRRSGPLEFIAFWQFLCFVLLVCLVWAKETLELYSLESEGPNAISACILTAAIIVVGFITIGHTYIQEQKVLKGLLVVCSYCGKIRLQDDAWERLDFYVQDRTLAEFSHGVCPDCLKKVMEAEIEGVKKPEARS